VNADLLDHVPRRPTGNEPPLSPASWVRGLSPFLDALREPVFQFDAAGRVEFVNRAFRELLGGAHVASEPERPIDGRRYAKPSWLPAGEYERWQMFVELHHSGRAQEFGIRAVQFTIEAPGAMSIHCEFTGERLRSETGEVLGVIAVVHPRTEQQRAERRTIDELAAELRRLSSAVRDLTGRDLAAQGRASLADGCTAAPLTAATRGTLDGRGLGRDHQSSTNHVAFERAIRDLSARERAILRGLLEGKRTTTIAREFFLSEHTVRNHLKRIYRKAGVHSLGELRENLTPIADALADTNEHR
jgi:DNA-binding CsgD family transcriptional regulator